MLGRGRGMTAQRYPLDFAQRYPQRPPQTVFTKQPTKQPVQHPTQQPTQQPSKPQVFPNPPAPPSFLRDIGALAFKIAMISIVFALVFILIYGFHRHTGPDMSPMVRDGDLVLFYRLGNVYSIGDLIVLDAQGQRQVLRVVANAGDTVDITDDGLIINGGLRHEPEIFQQTWRYANGVSFPLTVGAGQVFVLGDARESAVDSRDYGPVSTDDVLGTVMTIIRRRNF